MDLRARFEEKYIPEPNSGCWLWTASLDGRGYGQIASHGRPIRAHRLSYELYCGEITDGMLVCHQCDTPSCVNPAHLFLGSHRENSQDALKKNRLVSNLPDQAAKQFCKHGHPYTDSNTIYGIQKGKYKVRYCRKCLSIRNANRNRKNG